MSKSKKRDSDHNHSVLEDMTREQMAQAADNIKLALAQKGLLSSQQKQEQPHTGMPNPSGKRPRSPYAAAFASRIAKDLGISEEEAAEAIGTL